MSKSNSKVPWKGTQLMFNLSCLYCIKVQRVEFIIMVSWAKQFDNSISPDSPLVTGVDSMARVVTATFVAAAIFPGLSLEILGIFVHTVFWNCQKNKICTFLVHRVFWKSSKERDIYILSTHSILNIVVREKQDISLLTFAKCLSFSILCTARFYILIFFPSQIIQNFCECEFPCFWSWMVTDDLRCFGGRVWGRAGFGVVVPVPWITPGWAEMVQSGFLQQGLAKSLTIRQTSGRLVYTGHLLYSKYQIWCL